MSALLTVDELTTSINGAPILRGVSLSIKRGETLGLVGESGSGKSQMALAVMQLMAEGGAASGSIRFRKQELLGADEKTMSALRGHQIGMVFQEPMTALNPVKTIGDQVMESMIWHLRLSRGEAMSRAKRLLERVGLSPDRHSPSRYPHQLSGGQRQRVVLAIAIACKPKLLIADEPTTALDVTIQAQILALIKEIVKKDDMSLLLISHDLAVVADMADRVAIMRDGEIVETGPTGHLFKTLTHPYSKALFNASVHTPKRLRSVISEQKTAQGQALLQVRDLVRDYALPRKSLFGPRPHFRAVDKVSFDIFPGQTLGLVGESGSGKSTLARTILGLEPAQSGGVQILGQNPYSLKNAHRAAVRRAVQVVFQDPYGSFNPRHPVHRVIDEPMYLLREELNARDRRKRVDEVLEAVGLTAADGEKYPHEFSGGQRQRIAIARALTTRPKLIVADEPVSALDVSVRAQVLDLLAELRERFGLAYLFISHDLSIVRAITDHVMVMSGGKIVEQGETTQVLDKPRHPYTRLLVAAAPSLDAAIKRRAKRERKAGLAPSI